jgi:hypothetical protein
MVKWRISENNLNHEFHELARITRIKNYKNKGRENSCHSWTKKLGGNADNIVGKSNTQMGRGEKAT